MQARLPAPARRWSMLAIALTTTLCANVFINGVAFLIPTLHTERGLDLAEAGLISALPSFGMVVTLIAWGYLVDRFGERLVLAVGSALTAAAAFAAASAHSLRRGRRLPVPRRHGGREQQLRERPPGRRLVPAPPARSGDGHPPDGPASRSRFGRIGDSAAGRGQRRQRGPAVPGVACAVAAVISAVGVLDPPRPPRAEAHAEDLANPYRGSSTLWRIHAVSVLLVVPQCVVWTFTLVWLMTDRGWSAASAGAMVTVAQLLGAAGESRPAGGRTGRLPAAADPHHRHGAAAAMGLLAFTDPMDSPVSWP